MYLQNIELLNFKNYKETKVSFCSKLNFLTGPNGSGKTNLLDGIYYLSSGRSGLNAMDSQNINHEEQFFMAKGTFIIEEKKYTVGCQLQKGQKKTLLINKKKIERISEFIGRFPSVLITPDDNEVIREGSEIRRGFFDNIFSQLDKTYLNALINYTKALKIRNGLLKRFAEGFYFDKDLLEPYNNLLSENGNTIYDLRNKYLLEFLPAFNYYFNLLTKNKEQVNLEYKSSVFQEDILSQLEKSLAEDRVLQRTTKGIHKDDFIFSIGDHALKKFGSQGQQKSFLIALKFAHHITIKKTRNINPILLLDDIFDKLDEKRIAQLLDIVLNEEFGQVFITDARPSASIKSFKSVIQDKCIFKVEDNKVELIPNV
ncbi:MAG TPA: DNA replication and repair protein RecF [Cytophagales bacterium]|nr:DNA replication and repair protein RecF [Cytophagales bacterium]